MNFVDVRFSQGKQTASGRTATVGIRLHAAMSGHSPTHHYIASPAPSQANAMTAATNRAANAAGKANASVSAVLGARPNKANARAGAPVTRNSAVTIRPAPSSSPLVAASDPDRKVAKATKTHAAASTRHTMMVAVRSFIYAIRTPSWPTQKRIC